MKSDKDKPPMSDKKIVQLGRDMPANRIKNIRTMVQVHTYNEAELQKQKIIYAGMPDKKLLKIYRDTGTCWQI